MRAFGTEREFLDAVEAAWRGAAPDLAKALRAGVSEAEAEARAVGPASDGSLDLRLKGWVLRTEDVPVIEAIGIVGAAAAAALAPGAIGAAAVITAVTGFATLCWKAWRKGAPLTRDEIAVLGLLRIQGPMDLEELRRRAEEIEGLRAEDAVLALRSLTDVELRDGMIVELVRKDGSGRWRARSV